MNIKYQVGKDDELKCSKEEQENNKENEVLEEEKEKKEQAKLEEIKGWKRTTTLTLLSRLVEKGFLEADKTRRLTYYTSLVPEKDYLALESSHFFKKIFGKSLSSLVSTLHSNNDITEEDLKELEEWIKNR